MKKIVINDANVMVDLVKLSLIVQFFKLKGVKFMTTDFVFEELYPEQKLEFSEYIESNEFTIIHSAPNDLYEITKIKSEEKRLTVADCSAFYYAKKNNGVLLTGDAPLRRVTNRSGIEVHGIVYVFDELINNGIIDRTTAIEKMQELISFNPRLPIAEINERLERWSEGL